MLSIKKLLLLGTHSKLDLDISKHLQIVNAMTLLSLSILVISMIVGIVLGFPSQVLVFFVFVFCLTIIPLLLNKAGMVVASRIYFLSYSYIIIAFIAIVFPPEFHYQFFLVPGVGMALIFFNQEIGLWKWFFVWIGIPIWIAIDVLRLYFHPIFVFSEQTIEMVQFVNHLFTLTTSILMFYVFTNKNNEHIKTIENQNKELSHLNKEIEQFSYIITHDLKAPLLGVHGVVELIKENYADQLKGELLDLFGHIENKTNNMQHLIHDVLAYAKADKNNLEVSHFELSELIENCLESIAAPSSFSFHIPTALPSIESNYAQLHQIFSNLFGNAVKYHDQTQGIITLEFMDFNPNFYKFTISDDGPGIPAKYHKQIFDFFGTANSSNRADSTGIGLAIVKKLVNLHQGNIGLISEPGKGSHFWFTWPKRINYK